MQTAEKPDDLELKALAGFIGTARYYRVFGALVTDGVKYLMHNGYSWFVTDAIAVLKFKPKLKAESFLTVELHLAEDSEADLIITDGNENTLYRQHYDFTDAKRDLKLYFSNNVLMLASEY